MKCPGCGTEIANPGRFCGVCGRPLEQRLCPNGHVLAHGAEGCSICATTKHPVMPMPPAEGGGKAVGVHTPDKGKTLFEIGAWQDVKAEPAAPASAPQQDVLFETPRPGAAPAVVAAGGVRKTKMVGADAPAAAGGGLAAWLLGDVLRRDARDLRLMEGRNTIGASPKNDVVLDEDSVSSNHAAILCQAGTFFIEDNSSTNGTSVNGKRVSRSELNAGDTVTFGTFSLTFHPFRK